MSERISENGPESASPTPALFAARPPERSGGSAMLMTWAIAGFAVLVALGGGVAATRHKPKASPHGVQTLDPYASNLVLANLQMSESTALSAVKVTYIDGHIRNTGGRTVSGATVQVLFGNDEQLPPQIETLPVTLIRMREPYVDTEPVRADPIKPGQEREFRLIFENIGTNWNQQLPQIRVIGVE